LPRPTVRWRLTLLYSVMFVICAAALLAITYKLFADFAYSPPKPATGPAGTPLNPTSFRIASAMSVQRAIGLHRLKVYSAIALGVMTVVSVLLGWLIAGRVLAPLRTMTATTERISDTNLHERLAMAGPHDELRLLADTIDRLLARLETAFEAQRRFVANASHELRTPLARIRLALDVAVAKPGGVPPQVQALDASVREDLDLADQLFESFLTLAHAQNGWLDENAPVLLADVVNDALEAKQDAIAASESDLRVNLTPVRLAGSETLLRRMVDNVIENAARYSPRHGVIRVELGFEQGQARLEVESDGALLDQGAVTQLAQPFRRLGADRTGSSTGHGLGLSIVEAIAAAHHGTLELTARPTGGLKVRITLPRATAVRKVTVAV
jgi:signal transduction histidine kinase